MIEISPKVSATLTLGRDRDHRFFDLPPIIGQLLEQADVRVFRVDLGFDGNSIEYSTDQGSVRVVQVVDGTGAANLRVQCNTLRRGTREIGRQICFQLVRRLIARCQVASVHWRPTRQTLLPDEFRWSALADLPQRFATRSIAARLLQQASVPA